MRIFNIGMLLAVAILTGCQSDRHGGGGGGMTEPALLSDTTLVTGDRIELVVHGMSCPLCATSLDSEIARLSGYDSMTSDLGDGKVVVNFKGDKRPTKGEVADAVQTAGFTLKEFK